jgi:WD40 repeat protein
MRNLIKERRKIIAMCLTDSIDMLKDIAQLISEYDYWIIGQETLLKQSQIICAQPLIDGNIICGYSDFSLKIWNPDTIDTCSNAICTLTGHSDWVTCVKESPGINNRRCFMARHEDIVIFSGSYDKTIKIWTIDNTSKYQYKCETMQVDGLPILMEIIEQPTTTHIITGYVDGLIKILSNSYCSKTFEIIKVLDDGLMTKIKAIQVLSNDKICCIKEHGDEIIIWNIKSEKVENKFCPSNMKYTIGCIYLLSNKILACGFANGNIIMIDIFAAMTRNEISNGRIFDHIILFSGHGYWQQIQNITQLPDERLVSCDDEGNIKIWDIKPTLVENQSCTHSKYWQDECDLSLKELDRFRLVETIQYIVNAMDDGRIVCCSRGHSITIWS